MLFLPRNMKYDLDMLQLNIIEINEKYYGIYLHFTPREITISKRDI